MRYGKQITTVIKQRFSCRTYLPRPIEGSTRQELEQFIAGATKGPFGTRTRFRLITATEESSQALKGLGTYGFIQGAQAYIAGVVAEGEKDMEDFGWLMEDIVLLATALDLGTCWLGGTFTRSSFATKINLQTGETMPAVVSVGYMAQERSLRARLIGLGAASHTRLSWGHLFFSEEFGVPLSWEEAGVYADPLEMVRLGPSASNKQPWRVVRQGSAWHLYLQRTPGYGRGISSLFTTGDLQRVDMGIAMAHFELTAREAGIEGRWVVNDPRIAVPDGHTEYITTWVPSSQ